MNTRLIIGNWKMNPGTVSEAKKIARKIKRVVQSLGTTQVVVCPPFPLISHCIPRKETKNFHVGAQSVSFESDGSPHTGEVSVALLKDIGVEYVIVGHSEQRAKGDTDPMVSKRLKSVLEAGLKAVVCVGEDVHDKDGVYLEGLKNQIKNSLANIPSSLSKNIIIAYEPVWAIGAKEAMKPEEIYETSIFVKKVFSDIFTPEVGIKTTVLYGGSVSFRNAPDIITIGKVDGLLVGRESVNAPGFVALLKAVDSVV